jgi:hypothetical protein
MTTCDTSCPPGPKCQCYTNPKSTDPTRNQICAREADNTLITCSPGCCNNSKGCYGQCKGAPYEDAQKVHEDAPLVNKVDLLRDRTYRGVPVPIIILIIIILTLISMSTVSTIFN